MDLENDTLSLQSFADEKPHEANMTFGASSYGMLNLGIGQQAQMSSVFNFTPYREVPYTALVNMNGLVFEPLTLIF